MRFGEPSDAALTRELAEELGHELRVGELAFVAENIFDGDGVQHEIGLYYHVAWPTRLAPEDLGRGSAMGHKFCWTAARTLGSVRFEPAGLLHLLQSRPHTLEHIYRIWSQQARSLAAGSLLASMWSESRPVVRSAVL